MDGERQRDAQGTKTSILDAALVEFGEHGFAGARTVAIARRARVNPQLISYYFDGKAGLYQALARRWQTHAGPLSELDVPLDQVVGHFVRASVENRSWARLLVWEGLAGPEGRGEDSEAGTFFSTMVDGIRERQERGQIAQELNPATVLIVLFAAAVAPVSMPHVTERISGAPADSPEFLERYVDQLGQIVRQLTG